MLCESQDSKGGMYLSPKFPPLPGHPKAPEALSPPRAGGPGASRRQPQTSTQPSWKGTFHPLGLSSLLWAEPSQDPKEYSVLSAHQGGEEVSCPTSASPPPQAFLGGWAPPPCGGWGTWLSPKNSACWKDAKRDVPSGSSTAQAPCTPRATMSPGSQLTVSLKVSSNRPCLDCSNKWPQSGQRCIAGPDPGGHGTVAGLASKPGCCRAQVQSGKASGPLVPSPKPGFHPELRPSLPVPVV